MDLSDRTDRAMALARTYGTDRDGWERVEEYQRVLEWRGDHPNRGSSAAASALDLPRGRIRPWFDGAKPDPVHAVDTAEQHDWLDAQPGDRVFEALSILHAWIYAGGSIDRTNFVPMFAVGPDDPQDLAVEAFRAAGIEAAVARADEPGRPTEVRPAGAGGTHLGRYLHGVFGAPTGRKNERAEITIPSWLVEAGASTRLRWARVYVTLRGVRREGGWYGFTYQINEVRSQPFRRALGALLEAVAPADSVGIGSNAIFLRPAAVRELDVVPSLPE